MNARINGYNNTGVGSSNFPNSKGGCSVKIEMDRRSPTKVTLKSVTNNFKTTKNSVTNNSRTTPNSTANDPVIYPKYDKNINTLLLPAPEQNPPQVDCEATSKLTPRRSLRLTPSKLERTTAQTSKKNVDGPQSLVNGVVYLYEQKGTTKELVVVKPVTVRKLVLRKNTCGATKLRNENKSAQISIFSLMTESFLPRSIMIAHVLKTFGIHWESKLDK